LIVKADKLVGSWKSSEESGIESSFLM
jgi:hypothetical protein